VVSQVLLGRVATVSCFMQSSASSVLFGFWVLLSLLLKLLICISTETALAMITSKNLKIMRRVLIVLFVLPTANAT